MKRISIVMFLIVLIFVLLVSPTAKYETGECFAILGGGTHNEIKRGYFSYSLILKKSKFQYQIETIELKMDDKRKVLSVENRIVSFFFFSHFEFDYTQISCRGLTPGSVLEVIVK